jgi:nicotinamidase-related amidase
MRRLLIVVDCQKDFIDGALGFEGADKIIPGIIKRIAE